MNMVVLAAANFEHAAHSVCSISLWADRAGGARVVRRRLMPQTQLYKDALQIHWDPAPTFHTFVPHRFELVSRIPGLRIAQPWRVSRVIYSFQVLCCHFLDLL